MARGFFEYLFFVICQYLPTWQHTRIYGLQRSPTTACNLHPSEGVILTSLSGLSRMVEKMAVHTASFLEYLFIIFFCTLPENFSPRSAQVRSSDPTPKHTRTYLLLHHGYRFKGSKWNFQELIRASIATYKTYISEFCFRWPEVRSFLWHHYNGMWKWPFIPKVWVGVCYHLKMLLY